MYVGDSVANNVEINKIENKTESRIRRRKAYSSIYDKKAKWPKRNVKDVTEKALKQAPENDKYEHVILSSPTVDITNLDTTSIRPLDDNEALKQDIEISCKNMMNTAQNVLTANPEVKQVIILEHPPRFD